MVMIEKVTMDPILELERQGWQALSVGVDAAKEFYTSILDEDAVMLFPGGLRLEGKDQILASLDAQPWASFEIQQPQLVELAGDVYTLVYRVAARREGDLLYEALISSSYIRKEGTWKLILHQQSQA